MFSVRNKTTINLPATHSYLDLCLFLISSSFSEKSLMESVVDFFSDVVPQVIVQCFSIFFQFLKI